jgi:hypothetical protein
MDNIIDDELVRAAVERFDRLVAERNARRRAEGGEGSDPWRMVWGWSDASHEERMAQLGRRMQGGLLDACGLDVEVTLCVASDITIGHFATRRTRFLRRCAGALLAVLDNPIAGVSIGVGRIRGRLYIDGASTAAVLDGITSFGLGWVIQSIRQTHGWIDECARRYGAGPAD